MKRELTSNEDLYGIFRVLDIEPNTESFRMDSEHFGLYVRSEMFETGRKYYHEELHLKVGEVFKSGIITEDKITDDVTHFDKGEEILYARKEKYFVFFVNLLDRDWWIKENSFKGKIDENNKVYEELYEKCMNYYKAQNQETLLMPSITLELFAGGFIKRSRFEDRRTLIFSLRANFLAEVRRVT